MQELKLEQLKKLAGGSGSCGQDKGGSSSGCNNNQPKSSCGSKCS